MRAAVYRFLLIDNTGHVFGTGECHARDDREALEAAEKLCPTHGLEIWQSDRLVALLQKDGDTEPGGAFQLNVMSLPRTDH